jgi:hypothetical protein
VHTIHYRLNVSKNACGPPAQTMQDLLVLRYKYKVISVCNYALRHEDVCGSGGTAPPFVSSTLCEKPQQLSFNSRGNSHGYLLYRRLGMPHSWTELWRRENILHMPGMEPRLLGHLRHSQIAMLAGLSRIHLVIQYNITHHYYYYYYY